MAIANALNALNNVTGKTIACLENQQTFTKAQSVTPVALTSTANHVATNASLSNIFTLTLTENTTLDNPTNLVAGTKYTWIITQGASAFTVALGNLFLETLDTFVMPAGAGDKEILSTIYDGTNLIYSFDIQASSSFVLQNEVFVAKNGVNVPGGGNVASPYGDPFYATTQTTGSASNPHVINVSPGIYTSATLSVKPSVGYNGTKDAVINGSTSIVLDASWSGAASGSLASFSNISLEGLISFDFSSIATSSIGITLFNTESLNGVTIIGNDQPQLFEAESTNFGSTLDLQCIQAFIRDCMIESDLTISVKGSGTGDNVVHIDNSTINGNTTITGASGRTSTVYMRNSVIQGTITLDSTFVTLEIDIASYPAGGIAYTNGATSAQLFIVGGFSPADTVYVASNGSDSTATGQWFRPYQTINGAITATSGTVAAPKTLLIYPGIYQVTGSLSIKPNQTLFGFSNYTQINYSSGYTLDSSWSSASLGSLTTIENLLTQGNWTLDFSTLNCEFNGDISIAQSAGGGTATNIFSACYFSTQTDITLSGASGSVQTVYILSSPILGTLTVNTTFVTLNIDADSIPSGGITYSGGATSAQVNIVGGAPAKTFNNAYTGQNYTTPVAITSSAASVAWNLNTAPSAQHTATENTTLAAPTNQINGAYYSLRFIQDSTPRTFGWNSAYKFAGGVVPVVSTGSGAIDEFTFKSNGTNMYCVGQAQNIS